MPKAREIYVFDLDGTLVDSMPKYARGVLSILDEEGIAYAPDLIKLLTPMGNPRVADYYVHTLGVKDTVEHVIKRIVDKLVYEYTHEIYTKDGVREYLEALRGDGARLFVLTASPHISTDACLRHNGIFDWFETVWSVEDYGLTKSDTRIFYELARRIGCDPQDIHYFDDSPIALENAKAAGLRTYAVYDAQTDEEIATLKREHPTYVGSFTELI